jgi:hypothetical protein
MNAQDQEKLFAALQTAHPHWPKRFISGYVNGVLDEGMGSRPQRVMVEDAKEQSPYALGYLVGFAIRRGGDVEREPWFGFVSLVVEEVRAEKRQIDKA